jgi:DNA-binding transcriptional ArsR family regulator
MATTTVKTKPTTKPTKAKAAVSAKTEAAQRKKQVQRTANQIKQVSDATRIMAVLLIAEGERHVSSICEVVNMHQPAVSHHLALLRHGGIIAPRRQGKNVFYSLTDTGKQLAEIIKAVMT